jgi:hypothetical protein
MTRDGGWLLALLLLVFGFPARADAAGPPPGLPPPAVIVTETVEGRLLRIEVDLYAIKDDRGREVLVRTGKDSLIDRTMQVGDLVSAEVWKDGHARSIRKLPR